MNLSAAWTIRSALLLAAIASVGVRPAAAQQADTARITTALWTACPGAELRMTVQGEGRVRGECGRVADGRLLVTTRSGEREVALVAVDSLWVRRSYTPELTIGLALLGSVAAGLYADRTREEGCLNPLGCRGEHNSTVIKAAAAGGVGGGIVGVVIGPRFWRWVRAIPIKEP
ncbi:hypothetical protein [Longimicrobium sp.]|jgi:hypothetical protein|uniref:hypothetical protein n=1 Tax=Longimicrobium sp. TaxID=2029185 RepID=UPI002ED916FD